MKNVVIRIDYSDITNFEGLIQAIVPLLKSYFTERWKYTTNNVNVTFDEKVFENERIPVSVLPPNEVYRFSSCLIAPVQTVALDVANNFVCLIIDCDNSFVVFTAYMEMVTLNW